MAAWRLRFRDRLRREAMVIYIRDEGVEHERHGAAAWARGSPEMMGELGEKKKRKMMERGMLLKCWMLVTARLEDEDEGIWVKV